VYILKLTHIHEKLKGILGGWISLEGKVSGR
jgi:hypothetical protein